MNTQSLRNITFLFQKTNLAKYKDNKKSSFSMDKTSDLFQDNFTFCHQK